MYMHVVVVDVDLVGQSFITLAAAMTMRSTFDKS